MPNKVNRYISKEDLTVLKVFAFSNGFKVNGYTSKGLFLSFQKEIHILVMKILFCFKKREKNKNLQFRMYAL